ncbi:membrane protein [Bacillus sp. SA1-12]|uniref:hypothetical protein n=1 Tax=Bacillus sp. SA1-12 TaxID=1455638 RepID=UPI000625A8DA|nr:hypothetical protein [Bacillus sp. SA1-12]KKI93465.1 membrane protein [Bacillus sp. SA1-12]
MSLVGWMIVFCEIAFWVVIFLGLTARYLFKQKRFGLILLALTPLIDLILLITAGFDLYRGADATLAHALAAVYIGVSLAYGKSMIEWADQRFLYYVLKQGEKPRKQYGLDYAKHNFTNFLRHIIAYVIGAGLLAAIIFIVNDSSRTEALSGVLRIWSLALGIDLIFTISYFIWPRKEKKKAAGI